MIIDRHIHHALCTSFAPTPPEAGGILGQQNGCICAFAYDPGTPDLTRNCYTPNVDFLNRIIAQWLEQGITFCGIIHSHPPGQRQLSEADLSYIRAIRDCMPEQISELYFPIIIPGEGIFPYLSGCGGTITEDTIHIKKETSL